MYKRAFHNLTNFLILGRNYSNFLVLFLEVILKLTDLYLLWQNGLLIFRVGGTEFEKILPCQKLPNLTFKVNFQSQKAPKSFSFFSLKNINLRAHFLLLTFFDNINF